MKEVRKRRTYESAQFGGKFLIADRQGEAVTLAHESGAGEDLSVVWNYPKPVKITMPDGQDEVFIRKLESKGIDFERK